MSADAPITTDALTAILHKRAETTLREKIASIFPILRHPHPLLTHVTLPQHVVDKLKNGIKDGKHWLPTLLEAAQEGLYAAQVEAARAQEVADFLAKVETTAAELDAIREEMCQ